MIEVIVPGGRPIVDRRMLEEATASEGDWVVITDGSGRRPQGPAPAGGILVSTRAVTEAVKLVAGGRVTMSLDREHLAEVVLPVILSRSTLVEILAAGSEDPVDVVSRVAGRGGAVVTRS